MQYSIDTQCAIGYLKTLMHHEKTSRGGFRLYEIFREGESVRTHVAQDQTGGWGVTLNTPQAFMGMTGMS